MNSHEHRPPPGTPIDGPPTSQRSHRPGGGGIPISCNKCRKPLNTTVFVCACDCAFCEDCTYNHFNSRSNCPVCNRVLSENDFTELVVADPSTQSSTRVTQFQALFTKQSASSSNLPFQDLCARLLKHHDDARTATKFLMKQMLVEASKSGQRFQQLHRTYEATKQENTTLKQSFNTQKIRYEKALENAQQQLASATKKIAEKDRQLHQFRKLHDRMTPASPQGEQSSRRVSSGSNGHHRGGQVNMIPPSSSRQQPLPNLQPQAPPLQGFMIQKERQERARQQALEASHQRTPVFGNQHNPYANGTPLSTGSHGSGSGGIRDLSGNYAFSGGSGSGGNGSDQHPQKRRRAMSPSQAFSMQPPGSYSVARGPSNYFQLQQNGGGGGGYMGGGGGC